MKEFNMGLWIKRFLIIVSLFIVYDSIMNRLDEMHKYVLENRHEVNENINSDKFITMRDLGFEYHEVTDSRIKELDDAIDPNGKYYLLKMNNDDVNQKVHIELAMFRVSSNEIALELFENLIRVMYKEDLKGAECYFGGTCVIPNIDFDTTIQYLVPVDLNVWDVDQGYALNELFTTERNNIVLLKDNQVLMITHYDHSSLNSSHAQTFVDLFNKTDEIFK